MVINIEDMKICQMLNFQKINISKNSIKSIRLKNYDLIHYCYPSANVLRV